MREGDGLLPQLLHDKEYGQQLSGEIRTLIEKLNLVATRIDSGDGTVRKLINDPQLYDAVNDIVVGVNDSKLLRWLIRNRQKAGIRHRYDDAQKQGSEPKPEVTPATPPPTAPPAAPPPVARQPR